MSDMEKIRQAIREGTRFYDLGSGGACVLFPQRQEGFVCGWEELATELLRLAKIGLAVEDAERAGRSRALDELAQESQRLGLYEQKGDGK